MKNILLIIVGAILTLTSKSVAHAVGYNSMSIVVWGLMITLGVIIVIVGIYNIVKK